MATKWLKKLASPALLASGTYARHWAHAARLTPFSVVLVYHRVSDGSPQPRPRFNIESGISARVFERQIRFMMKHFTPIQCSQVLNSECPTPSFAVSFDDGYYDNFAIAAPILERLGVPATFFVMSDFVGSERLMWWEQVATLLRATSVKSLAYTSLLQGFHLQPPLSERLPLASDEQVESAYEHLCAVIRGGPANEINSLLHRLADLLEVPLPEIGRDHALMGWSELKELSRLGFEVGNHTASHCNVPMADSKALHREIVGAAQVIEKQLEVRALSFAYPYGFHDPAQADVKQMLKTSGCQVAFSGENGVATSLSEQYAVPRTRLNRGFGFACAYNVADALKTQPSLR